MSNTKPLNLAGKHFASRSDARTYLSRLRDRWIGQGPLSGEDETFLLQLLWCHPQAAEKVGAGFSHFEVRRGPAPDGRYYTWCFYVIDVLGTAVDFSTNKALRGAYERQAHAAVSTRKVCV